MAKQGRSPLEVRLTKVQCLWSPCLLGLCLGNIPLYYLNTVYVPSSEKHKIHPLEGP